MDIIFLGSSAFAVPSLRLLLSSGHRIRTVVTQPDRPSGRGLTLAFTPVKEVCLQRDIPLMQPEDINAHDTLQALAALRPELFIVIAYGQILSQQALEVPSRCCLNLHASLLPRYRGAAPINWAIINGEKESGVTVMKMVRRMDAGPVLLQTRMPIALEDTSASLGAKLAEEGAHLLLDALAVLASGSSVFVPQEEAGATFAPKLRKSDGLIHWQKKAEEIRDLIRGCYEWPGAYSAFRGKALKVFRADAVHVPRGLKAHQPGEIIRVSAEGIMVATGKGCLLLKEVQTDGSRRMTAAEFAAGQRIAAGESLGG